MKDKVLTVQVREDVLEKWMSSSIEGGGSGGGESNIEYLDVSSLGSYGVFILRFSLEGRVKSEKLGHYIAAPAASAIYMTTYDNDVVVEAVGFDFSEKMVEVVNGQKQEAPVSMVFDRIGIDPSTLPRLTKEQFYSLE